MLLLGIRRILELALVLAAGLVPGVAVAVIVGAILLLLSGALIALHLDTVAAAISSGVAILSGLATLASGAVLALSVAWSKSNQSLGFGGEASDTVFLCYAGVDRERAMSAKNVLNGAGLKVSMYDPEARFADPVTKVADSIEYAGVVVVINNLKHPSNWIAAELRYAHSLRKQVLFVRPGESPDPGKIRELAEAIDPNRRILGAHRRNLILEAFRGRVTEHELERSMGLKDAESDMNTDDETVEAERRGAQGCFLMALAFYAVSSGSLLGAGAVLAWNRWGPFS